MKTRDEKRNARKIDPTRRVMKIFMVGGAEAFNNTKLNEIQTATPGILGEITSAFINNLDGVVSTICMPSIIAIASAKEWRFKQLLIAERIRAGVSLRNTGKSKREEKALSIAQERFKTEMASKDHVKKVADAACDFLLHLHRSKDVEEAGAELLRQGVVLTWGALETLTRDIFETTVNARPLLSKKLLDSPDGRKLFQIKSMDLESLAAYGFDVSKSMGTFLTQNQDFSNLTTIRIIYKGIFTDDLELRRVLGLKDLWLLNQRRHIIVHNRGIVDRRYLELTGDKIILGTKLNLQPNVLEGYISLVKNTGIEMLTSAKKCLTNI